jgi:hypothetical protein
VSDSRHRQLSRIYERPIESDEDARAAVSADPGILASAIFLEAAESDDVTGAETARTYLADRLAFLSPFADDVADMVRSAFSERLSAWET